MEETTKPSKKTPPIKGATKVTIPTELINVRFYENQKRQALLTTINDGEEEDDVAEGRRNDNFLLSSVTTKELCDTVDNTLLKEPNPPPSSEDPVSVDSSSSVSSSLGFASSAQSDKSRKGSVDKKIWNLVNLINREKDSFFTTSSCSGRIILYTWDVSGDDEDEQSSGVRAAGSSSKLKKGCKWLLVSHDEIQPEELVNTYMATAKTPTNDCRMAPTGERDVYFKMEPCILHVQCRALSNARKLIHIATESGFRNSGMVIGKENRITVAIRSAMGLEVPLPRLMPESQEINVPQISGEYLKFLANTANAKMRENWLRSEKLTNLFAETDWTS